MATYKTGELIEVGDKAKRRKGSGNCTNCREGKTYEVVGGEGERIRLAGEDPPLNGCDCYHDWVLVEKRSPKNKLMTKLNSMMKRLLDAPTKKLIKAGIINGDLELTDKGREELQAIVFEEHKAELIKKAEEIIKEEKEDK